MFTSIKTSRANKERVTQLTRRLGLGAENLIARVGFAYSLSLGRKLELNRIQDAQGKEYNSRVLFGDYFDIYVSLIAVHYGLHRDDKLLPKYVKLHIDDGIELVDTEVSRKANITGTEFLIDKIEKGLKILA